MSGKPTPGPWTVDANGDCRGGFIITGYDKGTHIVICDRADFDHRAEMSLANSFLIASAPDLLAALKHEHAKAAPVHADFDIEGCDGCAAIAKAEPRWEEL